MKYILALLLLLAFALSLTGQGTPKQAAPAPTASTPDPNKPDTPKPSVPKGPLAPIDADLQTKIFDVQYADPERLRAIFAGRSMVIEANRDLKILTVRGSSAFLKEVEDTVKRFDLPPPPPANVQLTVYLLTTAAQAPAGVTLPSELTPISKDLGTPVLKLADTQIIRVREGQPGQAMGVDTGQTGASLSRVWLGSASVGPGRKGPMVSLYGLRIWMSMPSTPSATPGTANTTLRSDPDVSVDVDIDPNQPVMVSKVGVEKPVVIVVRATVVP